METPTIVGHTPRLPASAASSKHSPELDFHLSGFVAGREGFWTSAHLVQLRHFLSLRGMTPTSGELNDSLERARRDYLKDANRLFFVRGFALLQIACI